MATKKPRSELLELKNEISQLLETPIDNLVDAARTRTDAVVDQIKAAIDDLSETLLSDEDHIAKLIADRPIAALGSAFAAGLAIGLMLRRAR